MPTIVYKYGLLPPTFNADLVDEQILLAHRYRNKLTEIELERLDRVRAVLAAHPDVEPLAEEARRLDADLKKAVQAQKNARKRARARADTAEQRDVIRAARAALKGVRLELKAAKRVLAADEKAQRAVAVVNEEFANKKRAARAECGCYWGTYLIVEQAADAARKAKMDPRFHRWDGEGAVAVQIQHGITPARVLSGEDQRIQINLKPPYSSSRRAAMRRRGTLRLRVGSQGRDPIWAEWPIIMHRPLPTEGTIMWARVLRQRLAGRDRWTVSITVRLPDGWRREKCGAGTLAVDIGWRKMNDERGMRVAYAVSDTGEEIDYRLDPSVTGELRKVEDLRSIRDKRQNVMVEQFLPWLRSVCGAATDDEEHKPDQTDHASPEARNRGDALADVPEWFTEATKTCAQWHSPARFAALALRWRENRWHGDSEGYEILEAWRKKDKHLWQWEANARDQALARRKNFYRNWAAEMARTYRILVLEIFDLRNMQRHVLPESGIAEIAAARLQQRDAACSELRTALIQAFAARGGTVVEIDPAGSTQNCSWCSKSPEKPWDAAISIVHTCEHCRATWDQDLNAARNLLQWNSERNADSENGRTARVKDYGEMGDSKSPRWAKRHKSDGGARNDASNSAR